MNENFVIAFVVMPIVVMTLGWTAVILHERGAKRERERTRGVRDA